MYDILISKIPKTVLISNGCKNKNKKQNGRENTISNIKAMCYSILDKGWLLSSAYKINYSQPCIKRSPLGQRNCNLLKVAQFIWNILWQITKMWLLNTGDRSIEVTASTGLINLKKSNNIWLHCLKNIKPKITGTFSLFSHWKQIFVDPFPVTIWLLLVQPQQTVHLICIIESYTRNNLHKIYFSNSWLHFFVSCADIPK